MIENNDSINNWVCATAEVDFHVDRKHHPALAFYLSISGLHPYVWSRDLIACPMFGVAMITSFLIHVR